MEREIGIIFCVCVILFHFFPFFFVVIIYFRFLSRLNPDYWSREKKNEIANEKKQKFSMRPYFLRLYFIVFRLVVDIVILWNANKNISRDLRTKIFSVSFTSCSSSFSSSRFAYWNSRMQKHFHTGICIDFAFPFWNVSNRIEWTFALCQIFFIDKLYM